MLPILNVLLLLFVGFVAKPAALPNRYDYPAIFKASYSSLSAYGMVVDSSLNVYFTASATESIFGRTYKGGSDAIFIKLYSNGSLVWCSQIGGSGNDYGGGTGSDGMGLDLAEIRSQIVVRL